MVSDKWLASCHRRSISTMRNKIIAMLEQWDGRDNNVRNELIWLIDVMDNCDKYIYFHIKNQDCKKSAKD